jgi:predicted ester cyclase
MSVANKVLVYRWYEEVWNRKRESAIDEMLSPDVRMYGLTGDPTEAAHGTEAFKKYWRVMIGVFPDVQIAVESTIAEEDKVAARCSMRATHSGTGLGFEPTGRKIHITGVRIAVFQDGKTVEAWNNFDILAMYRQLGLFPGAIEWQL